MGGACAATVTLALVIAGRHPLSGDLDPSVECDGWDTRRSTTVSPGLIGGACEQRPLSPDDDWYRVCTATVTLGW